MNYECDYKETIQKKIKEVETFFESMLTKSENFLFKSKGHTRYSLFQTEEGSSKLNPESEVTLRPIFIRSMNKKTQQWKSFLCIEFWVYNDSADELQKCKINLNSLLEDSKNVVRKKDSNLVEFSHNITSDNEFSFTINLGVDFSEEEVYFW